MAIVIEESDNKRSSIMRYVSWGALLVLLGVAGYYIFFKSAEKVLTITTPENFEQVQALAQVNIDPNMIIQHPLFGSFLQHYVSPLMPASPGRPNPFLGFTAPPPPAPAPKPK